MTYRHEYKLPLTMGDFWLLKSRLSAVLPLDAHAAAAGFYHIRSLYLDTPDDKALREKLDGISRRDKFRVRYYNGDDRFISLEKKVKVADLGTKISAPLSRAEVERLLAGDIGFLRDRREDILRELYVRCRYEGLAPRTIVDYDRIPFVYGPGNVRVTLDYNIREGLNVWDFLSPSAPAAPPDACGPLMEIKHDAFLPDFIRDLVRLPGVSETAFSKYAACRVF